MKPSESHFFDIRGLRYHARTWGEPDATPIVLLHGWMDVSASFQFLVDALRGRWRAVAPDWRGYGLTAWGGSDSYWFPDYLADLDALLDRISPDAPAIVVGHSMGGNVASLYAGIRPERVRALVNIEGFGLAASDPADAPGRYARWLREIAEPASLKDYDSVEALAARLHKTNPRLTVERARFVAQHWGDASPEGRVRLRGDPAHKRINPVLYRLEEARACWRAVTAPVLWLEGAETRTPAQLHLAPAEVEARRACFARVEVRIVEGAGHMVHHDQPEAAAAAIEAFLHDLGIADRSSTTPRC